jgi:pimeloyl-ACP methyl ester carboxylesterase
MGHRRVVVLFHGAPGSRLFVPGAVGDDVDLVTFDRPGYGGEPPVEGRTLADTARQVAGLLDVRGAGRAELVGWSAGGPFAVATARVLGESRVTRLTLVSAPGPLDEVPGAWDALGDYQRPTAEMARKEPARSARAIARHMAPFVARPAAFLGSGNGPDGPILRDPTVRPMLDAQIAEALRQGAAGIAADLIAMWQPWGFRLADVTVPTRVFDAALDEHNHADARTYADRIPGATLTVWDDSGHLGIVRHWAEVIHG